MFLTIFALAAAVLGASFTGCSRSESARPRSRVRAISLRATEHPARTPRALPAGRGGFDIDWAFLASIGAQECASGECAGVNGSGCAGPMQIAYVRDTRAAPGRADAVGTLRRHADPAQPLPVNDPADAIYTAARILRQDMGAPPIGGTYAEYCQAACRYYGACADAAVAYAEEVMARAVQYGFNGAGSPTADQPAARANPSPHRGSAARACSHQKPRAASAIVQVAESQVGQGEHPPGSQLHDLRAVRGVVLAVRRLGVAARGRADPRSHRRLRLLRLALHLGRRTRRRCCRRRATPAPGDAVFYGTGPSDSEHVGIVARVLPDGEIVTVEGNYAGHVTRVGPFHRANRSASAPIYGYAQPPTPKPRGSSS